MALNHGFEKAIVRDIIIDLVITFLMIAFYIIIAIFTDSTFLLTLCIIAGTIQIIVGIIQTKDLILAIKNLRKKQKAWQEYGK